MGGFLRKMWAGYQTILTPKKFFHIAPETQWLEDVFPTKNSPFFGDMLVFRGVFLRRGFVWGG